VKAQIAIQRLQKRYMKISFIRLNQKPNTFQKCLPMLSTISPGLKSEFKDGLTRQVARVLLFLLFPQ